MYYVKGEGIGIDGLEGGSKGGGRGGGGGWLVYVRKVFKDSIEDSIEGHCVIVVEVIV